MKNSKKYFIVTLLSLSLIFALSLASCDGLPAPVNPNAPNNTDKPSDNNTPSTPNNDKKTFTGITLSDLTVEYNGQ